MSKPNELAQEIAKIAETSKNAEDALAKFIEVLEMRYYVIDSEEVDYRECYTDYDEAYELAREVRRLRLEEGK